MVWEIVFAVVTTLMMGLRLWAIRIRRSSIQMHDYFVFIAYVCFSSAFLPDII